MAAVCWSVGETVAVADDPELDAARMTLDGLRVRPSEPRPA